MRIAMVVGRFPDYTETFTLNRLKGLIEAGNDVHLFAFRRLKKESVHPIFIECGPGLKTTYLCSFSFLWIAVRAVLGLIDKTKYAYDLIFASQGHNANGIIRVRRFTGLLKGKLLVSFHGWDLTQHPQKNGNLIYKRLFAEALHLLPVCSFLKNRLISLGCDPRKITVIRTGIDCKLFSARKSLRKENETLRFISVGRLIEKKGIAFALKALSKLQREVSNFEYLIVGDGPLRESIVRTIQELGLERNARLLGWADQKHISDLMEDSDVLLTPSVESQDGDCEGIPNVVKEAMAKEMVVVATPHAGIPELITHGVNGYLSFEQANAEAFYQTIQLALKNKKQWERIGAAARKSILADYDTNKINQKLTCFFESVCRDAP